MQSGTEGAVAGPARRAASAGAATSGARLQGVVLYFLVTFALMLLFGGLAVLESRGAVTLPVPPVGLLAIGGMGPLVGAVIAAAYDGRGAAVRALLARIGLWRVSPLWYLTALYGPARVAARGRLGLPPDEPATVDDRSLPVLRHGAAQKAEN